MHTFDEDTTLPLSRQDEMLDELEVRCSTSVDGAREEGRRRRVHAAVYAGNACDRAGDALAELQTTELSSLSATGLGPRPVMVGSVFQLRFDRADVATPKMLAVCDRCAMLGDASFELRFRFLSPIELREQPPQ